LPTLLGKSRASDRVKALEKLIFMLELITLNSFQSLEIEFASTLLRLVLLFSLTLAIAFFVAAELSLVSASHQQIYQISQHNSEPSKAKAAQLVLDAQNNLQYYLSVTQTGTTAGSLLLGWLGEGATVHWIEPWINYLPIGKFPAVVTAHSIAVVVAFLLVTYVEIVLGELIPKVLATNAPEDTALLLIHPLKICSTLFNPLLIIFNGTVRLLTGGIILKRRHHPELLPSTTPIVHTDPYSALVSGDLDLATVDELLELTLPASSAYRTLGGFMIHHLGRIPTQDERLLWGELELEAAKVVDNRLETVLLRRVTRPLLSQPLEAVEAVEAIALNH
jgi:CBS domain containing-hemolysin-like protein